MHTARLHKIKRPLLLLAFVSMCALITTAAYFTLAKQEASAVFMTGVLDVSLTQTTQFNFDTVLPGSSHVIEFQAENTGNTPAYFKWYLDGIWSAEGLSSSVFSIASVERLNGEEWEQIGVAPAVMTEEFFFSQNGDEQNLYELQSGEIELFRVTVQVSEDLANEYQGQSFETSLHLAAKQVHESASWPATY